MALAIVDKRRQNANMCEVMNIIGDVEGKTCILFDDIVDTAGSLCNAAKAIIDHRQGQGRLCLRQPRRALRQRHRSASRTAASRSSMVLNTIPLPADYTGKKIRQLDASPIFAKAITRIYNENVDLEPVLMLFSKAPACGWLVVGLGNPGQNYARTRHNVGFRAVDALAEKLGVKIDRARFRGLTAQASAGGEKLLLLKPQTFMNNSGLSVMDAARFYKLPPERVLVLFDDISLPVGRLRVRADGSAGGHNGIKSIIGGLNEPELPAREDRRRREAASRITILPDWVLSNFTGPEDKLITEAHSPGRRAPRWRSSPAASPPPQMIITARAAVNDRRGGDSQTRHCAGELVQGNVIMVNAPELSLRGRFAPVAILAVARLDTQVGLGKRRNRLQEIPTSLRSSE